MVSTSSVGKALFTVHVIGCPRCALFGGEDPGLRTLPVLVTTGVRVAATYVRGDTTWPCGDTHHCVTSVRSWPTGKLPFDCQKIAKNLTFFSKTLPKIFILFKKLTMAIFLKKWKFLAIEKKKSSSWQFFDIQMAIFQKVRP